MTADALDKLLAGVREFGVVKSIIGLLSLARVSIQKPNSVTILTREDGLLLTFDYPSQAVPTLIVYRELAQAEYKFLNLVIERESSFFDVGGGIGTYSILASKRVSEPVHTFEPVAKNMESIRRNVRANRTNGDSDICLNAAALSGQEGYACMRRVGGVCSILSCRISQTVWIITVWW